MKSGKKILSSNQLNLTTQKTLRKILKNSYSKIVIKGYTKDTKKILLKNRIIIIANHPYESDPFLLFSSLPLRKEIFLIFTHIFTGINKEFDKHVIPVYVQHDTKNIMSIKKILLRLIHKYPLYAPEEEHDKNIKSIKKASSYIDKGGLVIITPSGRGRKQWYPGVGYLIKGLRKPAYVIFTHIQGSSNLDILRIFPYIGKILPTISIEFSFPLATNSLKKKAPKEIVATLEKKYHSLFKK